MDFEEYDESTYDFCIRFIWEFTIIVNKSDEGDMKNWKNLLPRSFYGHFGHKKMAFKLSGAHGGQYTLRF